MNLRITVVIQLNMHCLQMFRAELSIPPNVAFCVAIYLVNGIRIRIIFMHNNRNSFIQLRIVSVGWKCHIHIEISFEFGFVTENSILWHNVLGVKMR